MNSCHINMILLHGTHMTLLVTSLCHTTNALTSHTFRNVMFQSFVVQHGYSHQMMGMFLSNGFHLSWVLSTSCPAMKGISRHLWGPKFHSDFTIPCGILQWCHMSPKNQPLDPPKGLFYLPCVTLSMFNISSFATSHVHILWKSHVYLPDLHRTYHLSVS